MKLGRLSFTTSHHLGLAGAEIIIVAVGTPQRDDGSAVLSYLEQAEKEISNKLSPHLLTNHGLSSAIQSFVSKVEQSSGLRIDFVSDVKRRLGDEIEAAIYRAVIECINNTIKHAEASTISIMLSDADSQLHLHYRDDGKGFDLDETLAVKKGLGLFNLQNRVHTIGGKISLISKPGMGVDYQIAINL